jgi:hypothetical protein
MQRCTCKDCMFNGGQYTGENPHKPFRAAEYFIDIIYCKLWGMSALSITSCAHATKKEKRNEKQPSRVNAIS